MKKSQLMKKAAKSFAGRALRRLLGEEKGLVMMEYIIVGLLIAAVAVVAVAAFGNYASELFGAMGAAMSGQSTQAKVQVANADETYKGNQSAARSHAATMQDSEMKHSAAGDKSRGSKD